MQRIIVAILLFIVVSGLMFVPEPRRTISDGFKAPETRNTVSGLEVAQKPLIEGAERVPMTCVDYRDLVSKYDWPVDTILAIMRAESGCRYDAVGDTWAIAGLYAPSCGLMQVRTLAGRPSCEELKDPRTNVEWAYKLYKGGGLTHWSVYNNGAYRQWL